jgi:dipeptidyl aminopeptidase/acylaminoacyl peptidase
MDEWRRLRFPIEDPYGHHMIGGVHVDGEASYLFFDEATRKRWESTVRAYGVKEHVRFVSASSDFRKIIVLVEGASLGYQYQLVDLIHGRTELIGEVYKGLTSHFEVRRISFKAADGLDIPGYLTLPGGRKPERLALIVLPHGGPASISTMGFDWWAQALADQGYAVLQPNFRGSTVNHSFMTKGYGEFGRKMQTDLSDGVRYLVQEGIADPARVCIVGASYGGYAALAGVAFDPGVYRCAVSVAGISDLRAFLSWIDDKHASKENREQRYWDRFLGVQGRKDPRLDEISPIKHVKAIQSPVLLVHGKDDTVVPFDQSDNMYDALRAASKQVEFVTLKDEDHWLSRGATRLQLLQAVVDFLRKTNPPSEQSAMSVRPTQ